MNARRVPALCWAAHAVAVLTGVVLAVWPCSYRAMTAEVSSNSGAAARTSTSCSSLLEVSGPEVLTILAVPAVLTLVAAAGFALRLRVMFLVPTFLLGVACILTGFSIGMFFLPTVLLLAIACATWTDRSPHPAG